MTDIYFPAPGEPIEPKEVQLLKAKELKDILQSGRLPFVLFYECRRTCHAEVIVFDVEVELGQRRVHDIHYYERIAVEFYQDDSVLPKTLALRQEFPAVPHINLREQEFPRSLCLFDKPYSELKLHWSPVWFIESIRRWLALTAKGKLHAEDQPLEPLLIGFPWSLVLPFDLLWSESSVEDAKPLTLYSVPRGNNRWTLIVDQANRSIKPDEFKWIATTFHALPQSHGVIRIPPPNLKYLHDLMLTSGINLRQELRGRLNKWHEQHKDVLDKRLILIITLPKTRTINSQVESTEVRAFLTTKTIREIGVDIGIWDVYNGKIGLLIDTDNSKQGEEVNTLMLNCTYEFSRPLAAQLNGLTTEEEINITAIGVGALGSQLFMNLIRTGYGKWTLIDDDLLQPHNLARHALDGFAVGLPKAEEVAHRANQTIRDEPIATAIVADVLRPGNEREAVNKSLKTAHLILDMSTSVAVSRYLTRDIDSIARRVSLFLNPSGSDLVLLAEDAQRQTSLDLLEMQYYRHLINEPTLRDHLSHPEGRIRYAQSCRDLSSTVPQYLVALHAAIGSHALRAVMDRQSPTIAIWQADRNDLTVNRINVAPVKTFEKYFGNWTLYTDQWLIDKLMEKRLEKLPNETGGVLIGSFDMERKIVYVVETLPSDSIEWPTSYIRRYQGLTQQISQIKELTAGMLSYVGEWHSHPPNCGCRPSTDDGQAFTWLTEMMGLEGLPPLMIIVGHAQIAYYLGQMP